jgi:uncharacterized protein YcbX
VFPIKSFDGVAVEAAELTARGGLRNDRRFALFDAEGAIVNGKREGRLHALRVAYDESLSEVTLSNGPAGEPRSFRLDRENTALAAWLGNALGRDIRLHRDDDGGFPDDALAPGPTIVSTATLATVASWFPGLDVDSVRRRLRTNIEIDGVPPFWEDALYCGPGESVGFRIGSVDFEGTNPCQRCVVPSRDPDTGEPLAAFAKRVAEKRAATLPPWAQRTRFDHYYRLAVNTRALPLQAGRAVHVGEAVTLTSRIC